MLAEQLIRIGAYGPETIAVLIDALEGAWAEFLPHYTDPATHAPMRLKLASALLYHRS